jgi:hypothetical protein
MVFGEPCDGRHRESAPEVETQLLAEEFHVTQYYAPSELATATGS